MNTRPKILIVDDNHINLIVLKKVLQGLDATLIEANDGYEALTAIRQNDFALAILDVQMPDMDGYELAEHMRGSTRTRNVPIMFVTAAYDDEINMFRGYEAGGVDYLMKPYQPEVLLAKTRVFLELDHDRRELQRHKTRLEELVTDRVQDVNNLNKVFHLIRDIDRHIIHEKSSATLIQAACNTLATAEGFRNAWIILRNGLTGELESAQSGFEATMFERLLDLSQKNGTPACCKLTGASGDNIAVRDVTFDCGDCGDCGLSSVCNLDNAMISPLSHHECHYGWMLVCVSDDLKASKQVDALFGQIATDLGYALHSINAQFERDKAAGDLQISNAKLLRRNEEIQFFYHSLAHELKTCLI